MSERQPFGAGAAATNGQKARRRVGALWNRTAKETAEEFKTGEITFTPELQEALNTAETDKYGNKVIKIAVFANREKTDNNHPDYRIVLGRDRNS